MSWAGYEQAVRQVVMAATGLASASVIRSEQDGPRPATPFVDVRLGDLVAVGAADAVEQEYDAGADPGEEISLTVRGVRELAVTVRAFTPSAIGNSNARALLSQVQTYMRLDAARALFYAAGMTPFDVGTIQHVPAILDTKFEGRATMTLRFYVEQTATATTGYIETVELTDEGEDPDDVFTVP